MFTLPSGAVVAAVAIGFVVFGFIVGAASGIPAGRHEAHVAACVERCAPAVYEDHECEGARLVRCACKTVVTVEARE